MTPLWQGLPGGRQAEAPPAPVPSRAARPATEESYRKVQDAALVRHWDQAGPVLYVLNGAIADHRSLFDCAHGPEGERTPLPAVVFLADDFGEVTLRVLQGDPAR